MTVDYSHLQNKKIADILIVTATDIETAAVHQFMKPVCSDGILAITHNDITYYAGVLGGYNVIHCKCKNMGTQESGASTLTVATALQDWPCLKAVVMVGIAFGMYNDGDEPRQHFSDVLVASEIFPYENQKYKGDGSIDYRGKSHTATEEFLDAFAVVKRTWTNNNLYDEANNIEICPMLSGEKLVDNITRRNGLRDAFPTCRGGEMEGIGIAASCENKGKPWALVKSICDFADGKKGEDKEKKQEDAAMTAVKACIDAFNTENFGSKIGDRLNYYYRGQDYSKVFFLKYDKSCAPFYLGRHIDELLQPFILNTSCWVYGKSGMGKSVLLTRTLVENDVNFIYIDLSLCSNKDSLEVFRTIYSTVCQKLDIEQKDIYDFQDIVKAICEIFDSCYAGQVIYLLIDEIPFEHNTPVFADFVDMFCAMMSYCSRTINNSTVFFMLSSIASPISLFETPERKEKYSQVIKFIELKEWTIEECVQLVSTISSAVFLDWSEYEIEKFIDDFQVSPRSIKGALKDICSLGYRTVNDIVVNRIKLS